MHKVSGLIKCNAFRDADRTVKLNRKIFYRFVIFAIITEN